MLHSTMEVITQVTSNSLFVFLFCNLIIVILLVSSVKPGSGLDEDSSSHTLPVVANKKKKNGKYIIVRPSLFEESKGLITVSEVSNAQIASIDYGNNNDDNNNSSGNSCNTDRNNNNNNNNNNNSSGNSSNTATTISDNNNNNNSSGKNTTTTSGNNNNNNNNSSGHSSNNTTTTTSHNNDSSGENTTTTSGNNNSGNNDNNNNNDDDNDELRKKVEEFIEKVNRGWRAENLRTHSLVHIEKNPQPELTRIRAN